MWKYKACILIIPLVSCFLVNEGIPPPKHVQYPWKPSRSPSGAPSLCRCPGSLSKVWRWVLGYFYAFENFFLLDIIHWLDRDDNFKWDLENALRIVTYALWWLFSSAFNLARTGAETWSNLLPTHCWYARTLAAVCLPSIPSWSRDSTWGWAAPSHDTLRVDGGHYW